MNNSFMRRYLQKCDDLVTTHLLRQAEIGCKGWVMTNRFIRSPRTALRPQSNLSAFTLIEMLAVIAIMMALIAPAVGNFGSTAGRKGAVNILMNTMEQARVAALESGRDRSAVYLALGRPVVTEPSGAAAFLPAESGMFFVKDLESAIDAVQRVRSDWKKHSRAARACAVECFDSVKNLKKMLD